MVAMVLEQLSNYRKNRRANRRQDNLLKENAFYAHRFEAKNLEIPDAQGIKEILCRKFPEIRPKKKGSLSILAVYHHYNW